MSKSSPMLTFPALQTWLGKELEVRGIDAVIYTRYILSILQQDHFEVEGDPERDIFVHNKEARAKGKRQQKRRRSSWTAEDLKKNAVLECLQSVSGEECGIESLVEELCVKLKKVQEERERHSSGSLPGSRSNSPKDKPSSSTTAESSDTTPVSQAERYYEAFPALTDKTNLITTSDNKPHGAWGTKGSKGKNRSPRDIDNNNTKELTGIRFSKSASASRSSTSPTHNFKKHQRTNSLPDNVSHRYESPVFVVPKYQTKKGGYGNGHHHHRQDGKLSSKHGSMGTEKSVDKLEARKSRNGRKQKNGHHSLASLKSNTHKLKASSKERHAEDSSWYTLEVPSEQLEDNLHNSKLQTLYKLDSHGSPGNSGDTSLEEAVSSLAESLCRDIMDDYNGDLEELPKDTISKAIRSAAVKCGKYLDETEGSPSKILKLEGSIDSGLPRRRSAEDLTSIGCPERTTADSMFGTSLPLHYDYEFMLSEMQQGNRVWSVDTFGVTGDSQIGAADEAESSDDLIGSSSFLAAIWQKDLLDDSSPSPWSNNNTSSKLRTSSPNPDMESKQADILAGADDPDKSTPLEVVVEDGTVMVVGGGTTTTHMPIGTGRSNDSLLRICSPTHVHHSSHDGTFCSDHDDHIKSFTSWSTADGDGSDMQCVPPDALTPDTSQDGDNRKDSLTQGIKAGCDLNTSEEVQAFDVNSALWATYEAQPRFIQPPKIVRWEDGLFTGEHRLHKKKGAFIEGGVYGSPYNSCNNSHYSSCSTSPADSSIRELWERSASQEGASLLSSSLQRLLSPKLSRERLGSGPIGESTPQSLSPFDLTKSTDEKSVIEESLMESPVLLGSRSSSRFDFAQSMSDVGELSASPASGTETDEMVSEAEFIEEVMKETVDIRELTENLTEKCNNENVDWSTNMSTLKDVDSTPQNAAGFGLNHNFQTIGAVWGPPKGLDSGMLTAIKPVISKPEPVRTSGKQPDPVIGRPRDMFRGGGGEEFKTGVEDLLISPKTHFRPISERMSPDCVETEQDVSKNVQLENEGKFQQFQTLPPVGGVGQTEWSKPLFGVSDDSHFGLGSKDDPWSHGGGGWPDSGVNPPSQFMSLDSHVTAPNRDAVTSLNLKLSSTDAGTVLGNADMKRTRRLPRDRGPAELWDGGGGRQGSSTSGGGSETEGMKSGGSSVSGGFLGGQRALCGTEFDPTVTSDSEHQMFPYDDEVFLVEEGLLDEPGQIGPRTAYYSSDLEQQWMKESEPVAKLPTKKRKPRGLKYRPCSFFLEGNCRRAGCRFAHDLSRIPCRFWEEGQCLKEEDCPFLHGYPSGYSSQEDSRHASGSESLSRDEDEEQKVPEGLNKLPSTNKPKPLQSSDPAADQEEKKSFQTLVSGDTKTTHSHPVPVPSHQHHQQHHHSSNNNSSGGNSGASSGSSGNGKPPRSLPIQIVAKSR